MRLPAKTTLALLFCACLATVALAPTHRHPKKIKESGTHHPRPPRRLHPLFSCTSAAPRASRIGYAHDLQLKVVEALSSSSACRS